MCLEGTGADRLWFQFNFQMNNFSLEIVQFQFSNSNILPNLPFVINFYSFIAGGTDLLKQILHGCLVGLVTEQATAMQGV